MCLRCEAEGRALGDGVVEKKRARGRVRCRGGIGRMERCRGGISRRSGAG